MKKFGFWAVAAALLLALWASVPVAWGLLPLLK